MYKSLIHTMLTSKFMRVISVAGIILLLTLQYIWLRNSYQMVERDIMEKSKECLKEAVDADIYKRLGKETHASWSSEKELLPPNSEILAKTEITQSSDLSNCLQDVLDKIGKSCSVDKVDSILQKKISDQYGFIPKHTLRIIDDTTRYKITKALIASERANDYTLEMDSIYQNDSCKIYDIICGNSIFIKMGAKRSFELVLTSPAASVITEARYIFILSLLLVLLIGVILVFQLKSMIKDKEFTAFMKDYTKILAHEMRTPVNDIFMMISRLMSGTISDPEKRNIYQKECLNQCSKLLLGIDNILLVAKSEQAKLLIVKSEVNMQLFIENIADKYRNNYFQRKNLKINTQYDPEACMAYIDPDLMESTMINLIENAIKYSKDFVEITISCSVEKGRLSIKVKDNGFGISQQDLKHIFDIFNRGKKFGNEQIKGFGIGLYYVEKVIKAHRGSIKVASKEGVGSEFVLDIPNR